MFKQQKLPLKFTSEVTSGHSAVVQTEITVACIAYCYKSFHATETSLSFPIYSSCIAANTISPWKLAYKYSDNFLSAPPRCPTPSEAADATV